MESRTTISQVSFRKPFRLAGLDGEQPPGTYVVHRHEEMLDSLTTLGWRQTAATIEIRHDGGIYLVPIDSQEWRAALVQDGDQSTDPPSSPSVGARRPRQSRRA